MPSSLLVFSQSDNFIQVVDINSNTEWQTVQIQISWLLHLDLHCLQRQSVSGFSRTRVKMLFFFLRDLELDLLITLSFGCLPLQNGLIPLLALPTLFINFLIK